KISGQKFQRVSLVAALQDDKIIAPMNYKGTMTSEFFEKWFVEFLMKELKPNSVIVLDNASFHKIENLREYAKKYGHTVLNLPPYSPELNPIEKTWANLKNIYEV
ncbi:MAG: transposase, partial [Cardiobacteriaceae bacterium]|nr:transposase [Cardiobacteriaceae bacterium]